ncbi:MAG: hypothetical protein ACR2PK_09890 [Acidimicrobiales bacterium]
MESIDLNAFSCPRCGEMVSEEFYGPCDSCRGRLREQFESEGKSVETTAYEPKMNVTPNAVASKE